MHLRIGLSYAPDDIPKYGRYKQSLEIAAAKLEHTVEVVNLFEHPESIAQIDAVVFTGGVDIQPDRYGKQNEAELCIDVDKQRDEVEFSLAEKAEEQGLPILAVCRGAQLINIVRGGTLITDLEHFGGHDHSKLATDQDRRHQVDVMAGTYLSKIAGKREGEINSAHHQAIERLGDGLTIAARAAEDGTVEAFEWADPTGRPFLLGVQWHPERMSANERFSGRIFESFLWEVAAYKTLSSRIGTLRPSKAEPETTIESSRNGYETRS